MFPYHDELDIGINLPVIFRYNIDHSFDDEKMKDEFFIKYNMLFEVINQINNMLNDESFKDNLNNISFEEETNLYKKMYYTSGLDILQKNILEVTKIKKEMIRNYNVVELEQYLMSWGRIINQLYELNLYKINNYIKVMESFNDSLLDIGRIRKGIVENYLPNTWFITSEGYLYNSHSTHHTGGNFYYYYKEFQKKFLNGKIQIQKDNIKNDNNEKIDPFPEMSNPNKINEDGYVGFNAIEAFLHYKDFVMINSKSFDPNYKKIIMGMIRIEKDYYNFLQQLLYTKNPNEELRKIIDLTGDNYDDFLIRCCGVSKITNSPTRSIITSYIDYKTKFKKYIEKGWNIVFISPIVINEQKGIVEEYTDHKKISHVLKYCKSR